MSNILVTGGAGFIGSNLIDYLLEKWPNRNLINLDSLTYAADLSNLTQANKNNRYFFIEGDISDRKLVETIFREKKIQGVLHLAAESHVDNSIENPDVFVRTNVLGTFTLIDVARSVWFERPFVYRQDFENSIFLHVSTDEVYGTLPSTGFFSETTPYAPNSPYSASKAGSDMIVRSYFHTFGMKIKITNCSNNYGPKQHDEKLIPMIIRNALQEKKIPIYGDGKNIRDWLYVKDHCCALELVFENGAPGETYNIGTRNELENLALTNKICVILDKLLPRKDLLKYSDLISYVTDRPGHDRRYAIDSTKVESELGFKAKEDFDTAIEKTVKWYFEKYTNAN